MATVRMSGQLKRDIISNAKRTFTHRIKDWEDNNPRPESWGKRIYDTEVPDHVRTSVDAVPNGWCDETDTVQFTGFQFEDREGNEECRLPKEMSGSCGYDDKHYVDDYSFKSVDLTWKLERDYRIPHIKSNTVFEYNHKIKYADSKFDWLKIEYYEWLQPLFDLLKERRELIDNIEILLESSKTLAPMLKKWEGLWDLLPKTAKDRHKEIYEKPSNEDDKTENVDYDKVSAQLTMNKLMEK